MSTRTRTAFRPRLETAEPRLLLTAIAVAPAATVSAQATTLFSITVVNKTGETVHVKYDAFVPGPGGRFVEVNAFRNLPAITLANHGRDPRQISYTPPKGKAAEPYFVVKIHNTPLRLFEMAHVAKPAHANHATLTITRNGHGQLQTHVNF